VAGPLARLETARAAAPGGRGAGRGAVAGGLMSTKPITDATRSRGFESRRRGGFWLRLAISLLFMLWVIRKVEWRQFEHTIREVDPVFLGLSLAIMPFLVAVSAWKTRVLMAARQHSISLPECMRLYLVGLFFNNFLPTNVGGDVVRALMLGRRTGHMAEALACVFVERLTGLTTLAGMVLTAGLLAPAEVADAQVRGSVAAFLAAYLLLLWVIFDGRFRRLTRARQHVKLVAKIARFQDAVQTFHGHRAAMGWCMLLSVAFYLLAALNIYWSARTFRAELSYLQAFLVTPVVSVVSMFPSLGGIGLAEWAYLFGLGRFGVSPSAALSTALLIRTKAVLLSLLGAWGYVVHGRRAHPADRCPRLQREEGPAAAADAPGDLAGGKDLC